jgi:hypothetical protein
MKVGRYTENNCLYLQHFQKENVKVFCGSFTGLYPLNLIEAETIQINSLQTHSLHVSENLPRATICVAPYPQCMADPIPLLPWMHGSPCFTNGSSYMHNSFVDATEIERECKCFVFHMHNR